MLDEQVELYPASSPPLSPVTTARSVSVFPPMMASGDYPNFSAGRNSGLINGQASNPSKKRTQYLRRLTKFRHMDFEFAFWEMLYLFTFPQKVYRNFHYRKQTRGQWSRDDPAFLVVLALAFLGSSLGFALVLRFGLLSTMKFLVWVTLIDCLAVAVLAASLFYLLAERWLRVRPEKGPGSEHVEWAYAFDVHLNGFLPLVLILHLLQLPLLYPVILHDWFFSRFLGNTFWLIGFMYYFYITFLGYNNLPFLQKTQFLLYPMTVVLLLYIASLIVGWNFTQLLCDFYTYRVV